MSHVIEMRTYKTKPGRRADVVRLFRAKVVPAHQELGMEIKGPFLAVEDPDTFFWMRVFPSLASRAALKDQFYGGALWIDELEPQLLPLLERHDAILVEGAEPAARLPEVS